MSKNPFSPKQVEFILNSKSKFNLAHGSVRSGKTVCTLFRFIQAVHDCPGESIYITGYSLGTIYQNVICLLLNSEELQVFTPFCSWSRGNKELTIGQKTIRCIGAGDEGALGMIQGLTMDLVYGDEITLYPDNVIDMIKTRLSRPHSQLFASMNPKQPTHKVKEWIDWAEAGDKNYYSLHFTLDDNPYVAESYKQDLKKSLSGLFYKRNYLGLWCLADGAIFDFFDTNLHVNKRGCNAEYFIAGIDVGSVNPTACTLCAVNTGRTTQTGPKIWVIKEYYWNPAKTGRQKTNSELAIDIENFLRDYPVKQLYIDPSAAAFKLELRRRGIPCCDADNDVLEGIRTMTSLMQKGVLSVSPECPNLIQEIESYVWDTRKAKLGEDAPLKTNDHAVDALRYACFTHKISTYVQPMPEKTNYANYGQYRI